MRRTVVFLIFVVYIASILIVNFFGLNITIFKPSVYVSKIECYCLINRMEDEKVYDDAYLKNEIKYFTVPFIDNGSEYNMDNLNTNPNTYEIKVRVLPENANNKSYGFIYDESSIEGRVVVDEERGFVIFLKKNSGIKIKIIAEDGNNASENIYIFARLENKE